MKILIVGGTGHVGAFLSQIMKERGHEVVIASRGKTGSVEGYRSVICDSKDIESLKALRSENFDTVAVFPGTEYLVYQALADSINHFIACGSLWMLGIPNVVPTPAITQGECLVDAGYKRRYENILKMLDESKCKVTAIFPPNICGPGKIPLDGLGGRSIEVHKAHMRGEKVYLPDGPQNLIAPCDAYDIAMMFALAAEKPDKAAGQIFNVGASNSLTSTEFIKLYGRIYNSNIPIEYVSWEKYKNEISPGIGYWWHFYSHMCPDISKGEKLLGYKPKYSCEESVERAVKWMFDNKLL